MSESTNHNPSCREARILRATEFRDLKRLGPDLTGTISCSGLPLCICVTSIECMKLCETTPGCKYAIMVEPVPVTFAPYGSARQQRATLMPRRDEPLTRSNHSRQDQIARPYPDYGSGPKRL